jgi:hypothetical protein
MPSLEAILPFVGSLCVSPEDVVELEIMTCVFLYDGAAPNSSKLDEQANVLSLVLPVGLGPKVYAEAKGVWLDGGASPSQCKPLGPGIASAPKPKLLKFIIGSRRTADS